MSDRHPISETNRPPAVMLRYWGTHLKSPRHAGVIAADFHPLVKRGWKCFLVLTRPPEDPAWLNEFDELGVTVLYRVRPTKQFDWGCIRWTAQMVRTHGVAVFHCDNTHTSPLLGAFLGGAKVRVWSKLNMEPAFEQCRPLTFKERLAISTRLSCFLCHRVVAVSSGVRNEMVALGIPGKKFIIRNSPRIHAPPSQFDPASIRTGWGFGPEHTVVITVGRCSPVKAWDDLVTAFALVAKAAPQARLVLVGGYQAPAEQPLYEKMRAIMKEHDVEAKVVFTGFVSEVKPTLRAADIFVMPSRSEGASYALIEALDAHLPCVVTDVGNAREVIRDGENGFIVPRQDPAAIARALIPLVQDAPLRRQCASKAKIPEHILDMRESAEQFAMDYEALLQGRNVPVVPDRRLISVKA